MIGMSFMLAGCLLSRWFEYQVRMHDPLEAI